MRPARICTDRQLIVDVKHSAMSVAPASFGRRQMVNMGYYVSAAFYRRGIEAMFGVQPAYVFLAVETEAPFLCSLVGVDPHGFDLGSQKVAVGLRAWQSCAAAGKWPAYPTRVTYPEIPAWEDARWQERDIQDIGEHGIEYTPEQLWGKP